MKPVNEMALSDLWLEIEERYDDTGGEENRDVTSIANIFMSSAVTCLRKNRDYGSSVFKVPVFAPDCPAATSIRVRMSDKFERITNLLKLQLQGEGPKVNESLEDTIMDLGVYCFLLLVEMKRQKGEP